MPELSAVLQRLGLTPYLQVLCENGFHSWETVVDITEEDLTALSFKLGHRRALQREIATFRGIPPSFSLEPESKSPEPTSLSISALETLTRQTSSPPPREKRRYRRHPRPDANAPKKPKTAYVNFADRLRTDPVVSQLSFVHIAREVGRRWQELPAEQKRVWESSAARAMQEFEAQMDEYRKTDNWRRYQVYLRDFKVQQLTSTTGKRPGNSRATTDTSNATRPLSRTSPSSLDSPSSLPSSSSAEPEAETCHNALTLAFSELVMLRGEILNQGTRPYDEHHLPSEELVRRSMYAFIRGTGSLLFMWTYEQADEILDRIYRPQTRVDAMTLAECFTVAAMGAHYDMDCFSDRIRRVLYASGTLHFHEQTARQDYLRTMRLLLSMSFYALLEKHMSARFLIAAGLQIARWKCSALHSVNETIMDENWKRIIRSLIFVDCWLSYTLGYTPEATPSDIKKIATSLHRLDGVSVDELIHTQTSKIGLIAAEIAKTLASPELVTKENISLLNQKLESWRVEVPDTLQIPALTSSTPTNLTLYQRRAILMVHIMYLGALVLLYRQLLVATAETQLADGTACNPNFSISDARRYRNDCAVAAQQIARILSLIDFDGTLTKRCWLIIYWAFSAAVVLLSSATTKLADGQTEGVDADLKYAKACMDMLEPCRHFEPIAARYLNTLGPLYDSLRDSHQRMVGRSKTSIFALLQADPSTMSPPIAVSKQEMGPISEKLSLLLTDPFGRKQGSPGDGSTRRLLNADGSCSVFWWK
ncbi:Nn.00g013700.m01.CDS01 [Neocucurbitaria sp. VM-36]